MRSMKDAQPDPALQSLLRRKDDTEKGVSRTFFTKRGRLDFRHDKSGHRRFTYLYEDLLA